MRLLVLMICWWLAPLLPVAAQETPSEPTAPVLVPASPTRLPVAAQEIPAEPTAPVVVPASPTQPPAPGYRRLYLKAKRIAVSGRKFQCLGDSVLETENLSLHADELVFDADTNLATATGRCTLRAEGGTTCTGEALELNVATREWHARDYFAVFPPAFLGRPVVDDIYLKGERFGGTPKRLRGDRSELTTCDADEPHYEFTARRVEIVPDDKLVARDVDVYVAGHRVLHLPWMYLWLKKRRTPFLPVTGRNSEEGRYVRLLHQYVFDPENLGGVRLDFTEKLGAGYGLDHFYTLPGGYGEAFVYSRQQGKEHVVRLDHTQQLPLDFTLNFTGDVRRNSRFSDLATTLTNINTLLERRTPDGNLSLNYIRFLNEGLYSADSNTANLRYARSDADGSFSYSGEYSSYRQTGLPTPQAANQELWNRVHWTRNLDFGKLNLQMDSQVDPDGDAYQGDENASGLQTLPEIYLEMDQRSQRWSLFKHLPGAMTVGWGKFDEQPNNVQVGRYRFDWNVAPKPLKWGRTEVTPTARLNQYLYDNDDRTAQYRYRGDLTARTQFGAWTNTFSYGKQESHGFTPFRFDTTYPYENISESLQYRTDRLESYLTVGRDLRNERWSDLTWRAQARVTKAFSTEHALAYDLNVGDWRDLVSRFVYDDGHATAFKLGTRYDLEGARMRNVSTELYWVPSTQWKVQWLGGYDATNRKTLYNEFLVTRDLHCWDVSAHYSYQNKSLYLYFRLKALDLPLPQFGVGRGGQVLSTGGL